MINGSMENQPNSIRDLLEHYRLSFWDLNLLCVFCGNPLGLPDLVHFDDAPLMLVWRDNIPYGCCRACCCRAGMYEAYSYFQVAIPGSLIEQLSGESLLELDARCVTCLRRCDLADKLHVVWTNSWYYIVRNRYKIVCLNCSNAWRQAHNQ